VSSTAQEPRAAGSARYSILAIVLHWAIALAIVLQIVLAGRMEGPLTPETFAVTQLHKSVGITILLLSLVRLAWRLIHPPAPLPDTMARWERVLAQVVHVGFYVVMIAMPLTGWIMVSASRIQVPTLLYGVVPWPDVPGLHDLAPAAKRMWHEFGETAHGAIAKLIYVLLGLHVAGALKHQLFSRDEPVLARMAPGAVAGRWLEWRILAILAAFLGVIAFGRLVEPPKPGVAPPPAAVTPQAPAPEPAEAQAPRAPAAGAQTAQAQAPSVAPSAAGPSRWRVAPGSTLNFATSWSGTPIKGRFDRWRAGIVFSPEALDKSKVTVIVDLASVNTGDAQRDQTLPSADWFDTAAQPQAEFRADRFEKTGAGRYVAHGALKLKGVTRPLDLPFRLTIDGDRAEMSGTASLDRTAYKVGQGDFADTGQIPAKVQVRVQLHAVRDQR
jgi:cytochrome b561/polyisoprenoid-binding protein YceI